jgi:ketosteroid isomerase-like protein
MPTTTTPTRNDAQIRESIDAWAEALRAKEINALMAHYAPDIVTFDVMPLQSQGVDAYRKNFEAWFAAVQGPIDFEMRDLRITMSDDIAFCHYLGRVRSTRTTGQWLVTHEHVSVPLINMETMRAALASQHSSVPTLGT